MIIDLDHWKLNIFSVTSIGNDSKKLERKRNEIIIQNWNNRKKFDYDQWWFSENFSVFLLAMRIFFLYFCFFLWVTWRCWNWKIDSTNAILRRKSIDLSNDQIRSFIFICPSDYNFLCKLTKKKYWKSILTVESVLMTTGYDYRYFILDLWSIVFYFVSTKSIWIKRKKIHRQDNAKKVKDSSIFSGDSGFLHFLERIQKVLEDEFFFLVRAIIKFE